MPLKKWIKLKSEVVKKNKFWSYKLDNFIIGGDQRGEYHYLHTSGSTLIIPKLNNKFLLVNQFRYLNQSESIEFPCGSIEGNLSSKENAKKELQEETGYRAPDLTSIGKFSPFTGASDEICYVYLAETLEYAPISSDEFEEFEIMLLTDNEIDNMIRNGNIFDGMTIAAWQMIKLMNK